MKIFVQHKPECVPYGGGNQFVLFTIDYLKKQNIMVTFELEDKIDIYLIINPFVGPMRKYSIDDIYLHRNKINTKSKIFLRVNENDARKNTNHMDQKLLDAMNKSDSIIFISKWLQKYFINLGLKKESYIINMACDNKIFYPLQNKKFNTKIKLVTHHNSENWLKGFDIYQQIDNWLHKDTKSRDKFEFIYCGDINSRYINNCTTHVHKTNIINVANLLRICDIYITATRNEPGGNHHVEAASCGLPILYHNDGGGVVEMCQNYGEGFNNFDEFKIKLMKIVDNYNYYKNKIDYELLSSNKCCKKYLNLFNQN